MSDKYDDLTAANSDVLVQLKQITRHLHDLSNRVKRLSNDIDEAEDYSYQNNVKINGLPENASESALETSFLCANLFRQMGAEFLCKTSILPIAYRRGVKEMVPNLSFVNLSGGGRKLWKYVNEQLELTPQVSVCLLIPSSEAKESLIILLLKSRSYSLKSRNVKNVIITAFAGPRTLLFTSRRMRVPAPSK